MPYALEQGEPLAEGLRRALVEQLDVAAARLADVDAGELDEAVHEARKALKRSRTILRLLRDVIGQDRFRAANSRLRDAGISLSGARDAAVLVDALDAVVATGLLDATAIEGLRARLREEHAQEQQLAAADTGPRAQALERITAGRADGVRWLLEGDDLGESVERGLRRAYRRGRECMAAVEQQRSSASLHAWRKRVKDLGYAMRLLAPGWPGLLDALADECQQLWDLLGDDHDLALLQAAAVTRAAALATPADLTALIDALEVRRAELQARSLELGCRVYVESPKRFAGRICAYHRIWSEPGGLATSRR